MAKIKKKTPKTISATFDRIISGGQAIGTINTDPDDPNNGKKIMAWGVLPDETAEIQITKNKSTYMEGIATNIIKPNPRQRIAPKDPESYLSTSPWQIMDFEWEQLYKSALAEEAFELQNIVLPYPIETWTDHRQYNYRNKIEYSFWYDTDKNALDLAFFKRGTHYKTAVTHTSLAMPQITTLSQQVLQILNTHNVSGRDLKTLLIRASQAGQANWQLYVKNQEILTPELTQNLNAHPNGQIIYSNPKSPASVITELLHQTPDFTNLTDEILGVEYSYKTEGFFQINLPVYEQALKDIQEHISPNTPVLDLYSGVGTIGLSVAAQNPLTLVEINPVAVEEMQANIDQLKLSETAKAILASSEQATNHIKSDQIVIVDPPRAGMHPDVVQSLLEKQPPRVIYLSCNPVTQARDIAPLLDHYRITMHKGYNFFPRTPHIEHLVVLDKIKKS